MNATDKAAKRLRRKRRIVHAIRALIEAFLLASEVSERDETLARIVDGALSSWEDAHGVGGA